MENANSPEYLEKIKNQLIENLRRTAHAPSVQMQDVPPDFPQTLTEEEEAELNDLDDDENKDMRMTQRQWEKQREPENEYEDSDNEELDRANGVHPQNSVGGRKREFANYQKSDGDESGAPTPTNGNDAETIIKSKEVDEVMEDAQPEKEAEGIAEQEEQLKKAQKAANNVDQDGDVDMNGADTGTTATASEVKEEDPTSPKATSKAESPKPAEVAPEVETVAATTVEKEPSADKAVPEPEDVSVGKAPEASMDAMELDEPKDEAKSAKEDVDATPCPEAATEKTVEGNQEGSKGA